MKKPFNLRLPVLGACAMAFGIAYAVILCRCGADGVLILIPPIITFAACVPVAIKTRSASKPLILIFLIAFFLLGALYAYVKCVSYIREDVPTGILAEISGRVEEVNLTASGRRYLVLRNVTVDGVRVDGKLVAWLEPNAGEFSRQGYRVSFRSSVDRFALIENGGVNFRAADGVKYYATVYGGMTAKYGFSLFGEINYRLQSLLQANTSSETAAVCYAMLTGNTGAISEGTLNSFRYGGIAHVFAVSGLHIGVVYVSLTFVFKKLRLNGIASAVIKIAFITLYSGVCGFSPSSVRAVIMCSCSAAALCLHRKPDGWNALSIAAIVVLIINPLSLFTASFMLSFSAMLGITLLSGNLRSLFGFLPKKIRGALSVGLSAQFGTVPSMLANFGYVSAAGLFLNVIFIPLISVLYILLFVCTVISLIIPAAAPFLLAVAATPIEAVINAVVACGFEKSLITADASWLIYLPFAAVAIGFSDKFRLRPFIRCSLVAASAVAIVIGAVRQIPYKNAFVTFEGGNGGSIIVSTPGGSVLVITEDYIGRGTSYESVEAVVLLGDDVTVLNGLKGSFKRVYVSGGVMVVPVAGAEVINADSFETCGISFVYDDGVYGITVEGVTLTFGRYSVGEEYGGIPYCGRLNLCAYDGADTVLYTEYGNYGLKTCGKMRYELKNGDYYLLSSVPKE